MPDIPTFTNGGFLLLLAVITAGGVLAWLADQWPTVARLTDPTPMLGDLCPACLGTGDAPAGDPWTDCGTCDGMGALRSTRGRHSAPAGGALDA